MDSAMRFMSKEVGRAPQQLVAHAGEPPSLQPHGLPRLEETVLVATGALQDPLLPQCVTLRLPERRMAFAPLKPVSEALEHPAQHTHELAILDEVRGLQDSIDLSQ